jgi:hypothetical protein
VRSEIWRQCQQWSTLNTAYREKKGYKILSGGPK